MPDDSSIDSDALEVARAVAAELAAQGAQAVWLAGSHARGDAGSHSDIDVGVNIGARLQADQAEADMRVAQAKAEEKRAAASAREQEEIAHVQQNRAEVVLAEAEVPQAIASSFREGKLGLLDYYELKNVQADTRMRASIAGEEIESQADQAEA